MKRPILTPEQFMAEVLKQPSVGLVVKDGVTYFTGIALREPSAKPASEEPDLGLPEGTVIWSGTGSA